jgi:isochorismate synthase
LLILENNRGTPTKTPTDKIAGYHISKFINIENQRINKVEIIHRFNLENSSRSSSHTSTSLQGSGREAHELMVSEAVHSITQTELVKVVLSRVQEVEIALDKVATFDCMLNRYPDAFCYMLNSKKHGLWMGATPETLVRFTGEKLYTVSLAGTRHVDDLVHAPWTEKEREEQQIVTDYIINRLHAVGVSNVKVGPVEEVQAGKLLHLRSEITGQVKLKSRQVVVEALHPTPAVCGLPTDLARDYILQHENYDRSLYTGFIGLQGISDYEDTYFVNLRCMKIDQDKAKVYVGGGITAQSDPTEEFEETINKARTMLDVMVPKKEIG